MSLSRLSSHFRHLPIQAGPKPFPSSYNVGIDIAKISRFEAIIITRPRDKPKLLPLPNCLDRDGDVLNSGLRYFIRKVFTYSEWPRLESVLKQYIETPNDKEVLAHLATYLAGRWAVKEAAIKAHSYRRLHYRDVIILYQNDLPDLYPHSNAGAPIVLVKPPKSQVLMTDAVAQQRGLWRHGNVTSDIGAKQYRFVKPNIDELQVARCSISHDRDYATAIVYALDEAVTEQGLESFIDNGQGDPIHEPFIGDIVC